MLQSLFKLAALRCADGTCSSALRSKTGGEGIQRCPDLIKIHDPVGIEWRHGQAAFATFRQQTLVLEELKRMTDRLPRNAEPFGQFLLTYPAAWNQTAVRY